MAPEKRELSWLEITTIAHVDRFLKWLKETSLTRGQAIKLRTAIYDAVERRQNGNS